MLKTILLVYAGLVAGVESRTLRPEVVVEEGVRFINVYKFQDRGDIADVEEVLHDDVGYFVFKGNDPILVKFWASASFKLDLASVDYQVYTNLQFTVVHFLSTLCRGVYRLSVRGKIFCPSREFFFSHFTKS